MTEATAVQQGVSTNPPVVTTADTGTTSGRFNVFTGKNPTAEMGYLSAGFENFAKRPTKALINLVAAVVSLVSTIITGAITVGGRYNTLCARNLFNASKAALSTTALAFLSNSRIDDIANGVMNFCRRSAPTTTERPNPTGDQSGVLPGDTFETEDA